MAVAGAPLRISRWEPSEPGYAFHATYDPQLDLFAVRAGEPGEAVSIDYPDGMVACADPESRELLGIEFYDVHALSLKRHPELAGAWRAFTQSWTPLDRLRLRLGRPIRKTMAPAASRAIGRELAALIHAQLA